MSEQSEGPDGGFIRKSVVLLTANYRIRGKILLGVDERITDHVTSAKNFLAVVDAEVRANDGRIIFQTEFLNVHRDHIELIAPEELTHRP